MSILPWESLQDVEDLLARASQSLAWPMAPGAAWPGLLAATPRVDIFERNGAYVIEADVPGIARDNLHVSVDAGVLTISGERHRETREDRGRCHRLERSSGSFLRRFTLPADCDSAGLTASCQDGQLRITLPRKAASAASTAIEVPVQ